MISFRAYFAVSSQMILLSGQEDQLFNIMSGFWWKKLIVQHYNCYCVFLTCWMTVCWHESFIVIVIVAQTVETHLQKHASVSSRFNETRITLWHSFEAVTLHSQGSNSKDADGYVNSIIPNILWNRILIEKSHFNFAIVQLSSKMLMLFNFYLLNIAVVTVRDTGTAFDDKSLFFSLIPHCNSLFHRHCCHQAVIARKV